MNQDPDLAELLAEAILATRSDAIVATDRDGIIRFWNPGAPKESSASPATKRPGARLS